jgi:hypothetical protein
VAGVFQWVQSTGNNMYNLGYDVAVDAANNVYITGEMYNTIAFGTTVLSAPSFNAYVAKYNPAGIPQWGLTPNANMGDRGEGVAVDAGGNVYFAGVHTSTTAQVINFGPYTFPAYVGGRGWVARLGVACTPPAAPVISSNGAVCEGQPLTLSATGVPSGSTYLWTGPGGFSATSPTVSVTGAAALSGPYTLSIGSTTACPVTSTALSVVVNPAPATPSVAYSNGTLSSSAATGNQWYLNGQPIAGATAGTFVPTVSGTYTVVATGANGCASPPSLPASLVLAARSAAPGTSMQVYPNPGPAGSVLQVQLFGYQHGVELRLLDGMGRPLRQQAVAPASSRAQLDVAGLPAGLYILQALTSNGLDIQRVVLE